MNTNISERTLPLQGIRVMLMLGIVLLHTYKNPVFGNAFQLVSFFLLYLASFTETNVLILSTSRKNIRCIPPILDSSVFIRVNLLYQRW